MDGWNWREKPREWRFHRGFLHENARFRAGENVLAITPVVPKSAPDEQVSEAPYPGN